MEHARAHVLALVADVPEERMCLQSVAGEHHANWTLGHLLLSDSYLLFLLGVRPLSDDFTILLRKFGPGAVASGSEGDYEAKSVVSARLAETGALRANAIRAMSDSDLAAPTPDAVLARTQPTIGQHLQALVFHEGYHAGQLSAWRKSHGFAAVRWVFAPA